jgi:pSer/pThr/pTyr-binding forkhead associated (FHA) protein
MNRITKLFGHKDDDDEGKSASAASSPPAASSPAAEQSVQNLAEQEFGLMFTFESGKSKTFTTLPFVIGRGEQSALVLQDPSISTQHAYVYYDERLQKVCISDLDSTNGLFINDQPTRRNILQDEARIRLGSVMLTFRDTGYIHSGS